MKNMPERTNGRLEQPSPSFLASMTDFVIGGGRGGQGGMILGWFKHIKFIVHLISIIITISIILYVKYNEIIV